MTSEEAVVLLCKQMMLKLHEVNISLAAITGLLEGRGIPREEFLAIKQTIEATPKALQEVERIKNFGKSELDSLLREFEGTIH